MRYLIDTNVVSELRIGTRCDPAVVAWEQAELIPHGGAISVLTIGEVRKGIKLIFQRDQQQAARFELWLTGLFQDFAGRILPVPKEVAEEWGRLNALRPLPAVDSLLGATAKVHALILATRKCGICAQLASTSLIRSSLASARETTSIPGTHDSIRAFHQQVTLPERPPEIK